MSVRGYADLFQYAAAHSPEERDKHLARLRAEAARMGYLLDDLLMLARLDAADVETPLRLEEADLVRLALQAADAFRAGHPGHPLTVTTGSDPVRLRLDPLRLRQVLDNLLTNAAVHTPHGTKVGLEVSVDSGTAEVRITDSGPGIPADDRERVFDRFYRVDKARSRDRGGSGLGLAVARSLVRAHGGTIDLTSHPGATTFTVRLPRGRATAMVGAGPECRRQSHRERGRGVVRSRSTVRARAGRRRDHEGGCAAEASGPCRRAAPPGAEGPPRTHGPRRTLRHGVISGSPRAASPAPSGGLI